MIPKTIHYCWFGRKPLPELALRCIQSWQHYCPGWEIKQWNEENFDVDAIPYTRQAYAAGRYAFVSDYARFVILHSHGGVYLDTDVELIAPIDDLLAAGPFMGAENSLADGATHIDVAPGLGFATPEGFPLLQEVMDSYRLDTFEKDGQQDLTTVVARMTRILRRYGLRDTDDVQTLDCGLTIYPRQYLSPKDKDSGEVTITPLTRSIHHYDGSWLSPTERYVLHAAARWTWLPLKLRYVLARFIGTWRNESPSRAIGETTRWLRERL